MRCSVTGATENLETRASSFFPHSNEYHKDVPRGVEPYEDLILLATNKKNFMVRGCEWLRDEEVDSLSGFVGLTSGIMIGGLVNISLLFLPALVAGAGDIVYTSKNLKYV